MSKLLTVAEMALREIARRRTVLVILLLMPLAFYLRRRGDHLGQSIRFVCLGLGWALSTAALFTGSASRKIEPRLRLSGYSTWHLYLGRLAALWTVGILLSAPYFLLTRLDQDDVRYGAIALIMGFTVLVAAPLGLALSALLPPGGVVVLALTLIVAAASTIRLRRRAHLQFTSAHRAVPLGREHGRAASRPTAVTTPGFNPLICPEAVEWRSHLFCLTTCDGAAVLTWVWPTMGCQAHRACL